MMAFFKLLNMAFTTVLLLDLTILKVEACRCLTPGLYEGFEAADVVMHATALYRSEEDDDVRYTLDTITLYKEEADVTYTPKIDFITDSGSFLCGITLELGTDYLIGLSRSSSNDLTASKCGLFWEWSSVSDEDKVSLEAGCTDDPCDEACGKFQECLYFPSDSPGVYYCADVCDPSPCADDEVCTLEYVECVLAPCPPIAICTASSDD